MTLFDCYVAVDWSAANKATTGADSIWVSARWKEHGSNRSLIENIGTRSEATDYLRALLFEARRKGHRVLAGFDFAFGYPTGFAARLTGAPGWRGIWERFAEDISDGDDNQSNRFEVAATYNQELGVERFWGKPHQHKELYPALPATKPFAGGMLDKRYVETCVPSAKSVFQMAYNGAVGSQTMLGIARLESLRAEFSAKIWPFETDFADQLPEGPAPVFAEIYPTLALPSPPEGEIKDRAQVRAMTMLLDSADAQGKLGALLSPPPGCSEEDRTRMLNEEGSILGAGVL